MNLTGAHAQSEASGLHAYLINLKANPARWEAIVASARDHAPGIVLCRIDAVDGRSAQDADLAPVDAHMFRRNCGREFLPGEHGCYTSHLNAIRAFVDEGSPYALILEDDVVFEAGSAARIAAIVEAVPGFGVIKLVNHRTAFFVELCESAQGDMIGRTLQGPQGSAAAYIISRDAGRRLLKALATMRLPWDVALERSWDHGVSVVTARSNVLGFSEHRASSDISPAGYEAGKLPWYRRLDTGFFRTLDHIRRLHHMWERSSLPFSTNTGSLPPSEALPRWKEAAAAVLVLLFVSAVWVESDAYRYAGMALFAPAMYRYLVRDIWSYRQRPDIGWMGALCQVWVVFVLLRLAFGHLVYPESGLGSAEGIYLLPVFYSATGYGLLLYVRRPFVLVTAFMALSALSFAFGIEYRLGSIARSATLLHNNPIHGAVAAGMICLCAVAYALHVARRAGLEGWTRAALLALAGATFLLSLAAVYGLQSKGVWLAMLVAMPVLLVSLLFVRGRAGRNVAAIVLVVVAAGLFFASPLIERLAGPTAGTSWSLVESIASGNGIGTALDMQIADPATPTSSRERMVLWSNALKIWQQSPVFGAGITWLNEWNNQPYQTHFDLMHNGYAEIAIRYGLVGLAFYGLLFMWAIAAVRKAARAELISPSVFPCYLAVNLFFAVTLLSNSNIRLAIGESFMWFAASFAFYCHFKLQYAFRGRSIERPAGA